MSCWVTKCLLNRVYQTNITLVYSKCFLSCGCHDIPGPVVTWHQTFVGPCCSILHVDGCRRLTRPSRTFTGWWTFPRSFLFQKQWQTTTRSWPWYSGRLATTCSMLLLSSSCSSCPRRWRRTSHLRNCRGEDSRWYCPLVADGGMLTRYGGYRGSKIPEADQNLHCCLAVWYWFIKG